MIRQLSRRSAVITPTLNLKATIESIFRFQDNVPPPPPDEIDITTITYVNYKKVIDMVTHCISTIQSEMMTIDPCDLKDVLFILQLAVSTLQYRLNLTDSQIEHLQEYLNAQPEWKRYLGGQARRSLQQYQQLQTDYKKLTRTWSLLTRRSFELQRTIRHMALAMVKSELPANERKFIIGIEILEEQKAQLVQVLTEIEVQIQQAIERGKIIYYEADRAKIFNVLLKMKLALETSAPFAK